MYKTAGVDKALEGCLPIMQLNHTPHCSYQQIHSQTIQTIAEIHEGDKTKGELHVRVPLNTN